MDEQIKGIKIHRIVKVTVKDGVRTEHELTPEEIEEWKKEHKNRARTNNK